MATFLSYPGRCGDDPEQVEQLQRACRQAKKQLKAKLSGEPWYRNIGIGTNERCGKLARPCVNLVVHLSAPIEEGHFWYGREADGTGGVIVQVIKNSGEIRAFGFDCSVGGSGAPERSFMDVAAGAIELSPAYFEAWNRWKTSGLVVVLGLLALDVIRGEE